MNISGLEIDCDGTNYASAGMVKHSKKYSGAYGKRKQSIPC
jgi:hypothetical protein